MDFPAVFRKTGQTSIYEKITSRPLIRCRMRQCGCSSSEVARRIARPSRVGNGIRQDFVDNFGPDRRR